MARLSLLALALGLVARGSAAQTDGNDLRVWATVAFINHGEKTPSLGGTQEVLTPEGAQQMWRQGNAFRARYLNSSVGLNTSELEAIGSAVIEGMATNSIDNAQLDIVAVEDEWVSTSALAFLQGLYPPTTGNYADQVGGDDIASNLLLDPPVPVHYPLGGYQYPRLQILSSLDSGSPSVQGTVGCTAWSDEMSRNFTTRGDVKKLAEDTQDFYQDLFTSAQLKGIIAADETNFWHAFELFEYVQYMYTYNQDVHDHLPNATDTLGKLEDNALALERAKNSPPYEGGGGTSKDLVSIAGRTLMANIANQMQRTLEKNGKRNQMSLNFGSFEPLLAFLSLSGLITDENPKSGPFSEFPQPGATLVFEIVGDAANTKPVEGDLSVRFHYRASADSASAFQSFSLFEWGSSDKTMPYPSFRRNMIKLGVSSDTWCDVCKPSSASWCRGHDGSGPGSSDSSSSGSGKKSRSFHIHPALAGLIGALIMAALITLLAIALFILGGFRIRHVTQADRVVMNPVTRTKSASTNGGYKGSEKKQPDRDMTIWRVADSEGETDIGDQRAGSWEMQNGPDMLGISDNMHEQEEYTSSTEYGSPRMEARGEMKIPRRKRTEDEDAETDEDDSYIEVRPRESL